MSKKVWVVGLVVVLFVAGAFLHRTYKERHADAGIIKIGVAVAQTGIAAQWGEGEYRTIKMMVDDINAKGGVGGKQIELVAEDTRSDQNGTTNAILKLVSIDKVPVIIGPTWGDSYQGGYPIIESNAVAVVAPSAAFEAIENRSDFSYLFSTWWPQQAEVDAFKRYALTHDIKRIAVINDQDAFTTAFAHDVVEAVSSTPGLTLTTQVQMPLESRDYRTALLKVKDTNPDTVFILINDDSQYGPLMKQSRELKLPYRFFSVTSAQNEALLANFSKEADGLMYTYPHVPDSKTYTDMLAEYSSRYGSMPSSPSFTNTINAVNVVFEALKQGASSGTEIRDALEKIEVPGVGVSTVSFTKEHQVNNAQFDIKMIKDGAFMFVE